MIIPRESLYLKESLGWAQLIREGVGWPLTDLGQLVLGPLERFSSAQIYISRFPAT